MPKTIIGKVCLTMVLLLSICSIYSVTGCSNTFSVEIHPSSGGTVTPSGGSYDNGVVVQVTAAPSQGYRFDHWEGALSGKSSVASVTISGNTKVIAYFVKTYVLNVSPSNGGTVTPSQGTFDEGQSVTLVESPATYYQFTGWSGDTSGTLSSITVIMDSDKNINATFSRITYSLQTSVGTPGGGTIAPASGSFGAGTTVTVTATPSQGYKFKNWDNSSSTSNVISILMDGAKTITAFFAKILNLMVAVSPSGSGTVTPTSGSYIQGDKVNLTATSVFPYAFQSWTNTDNNSINPTIVTMQADTNVTAYFKQLSPGSLITKSDQLSGPAIVATFQLSAGQWVQGQISGNPFNLNSQIIDSNNKVIDDLGQSLNSTFQFQAPTTGTYYFDITSINSILFNRYSLTYTIYS